jgi:ribosomal protein L7/L12
MDDQQMVILQTRVSLLERQVKFLLGQSQIPFVDYGENDFSEVLALRRQGKLIEAIKLYRSITGAGLAEAKTFVEGL